MAGGAYLSAKKGASELVSKHCCRSPGVVASIFCGPRRVALHTQISNLHKTSFTFTDHHENLVHVPIDVPAPCIQHIINQS